MNKVTIEQKAKAYDEALKVASKYKDIHIMFSSIQEEMFPELKESEDEKTKRLLHTIANKMGQHLRDIFTEEEYQCFDAWSNAWLEKQGEQNHTDKVKTKFHEGDWVILTAGELSTTLQIVKSDTNKKLYWFNDGSYLPIVDEECLHLWTIQDAKDGDVVVDKSDGTIGIFQSIGHHPDGGSYNDTSYCFLHCHCDDEFFYADFEHGNEIDSDDLVPATKEQRNLLFQKMKEAGYEWDAEKKELRKVEQKPVPKFKVGDVVLSSNGASLLIVGITDYCYNCVTCATNDEYSFGFDIQDEFELVEQKPWSEEDEKHIHSIISTIECCKAQYKEAIAVIEQYDSDLDWLKSLRPQSTWKPSDEQMGALWDSIKHNLHLHPVLESLYNDLKKLKG